eukprot:gene10402-7397_t
MLSVTKAYEDFRLVRVLVVPIGVNSQFEDQFRILSRLETVPLYDLNKPQYPKGYSPPFKYLDWLKGELCFDFLRYDQAPSGPTDFEDFQSSKRIVIIMGALNYPDFITHSEVLEGEMDRFAKRYPNILIKKIVVFNYNFDSSSSLRMQAAPGLLEIFPPDGDCEGGSMLDVHFRQVMAQTSVQLVQALEAQMDHCEDARLRGAFPANPSLVTCFDEKDDARGGSAKTAKVFRKRPAGRIRKWMGDLSLQVCSPLDAVDHYVAAIGESRAQGDALWLAGALDGYASAILLLQELAFDVEEAIGKDLKTVTQPAAPSDEDDDYGDDEDGAAPQGRAHVPEVFLLAEERAAEALAFYESHVAFKNMELESCFRLARLYEARVAWHPRRLQKLSEYVMRAVAIPGLSARQQLDAVLEAALVCRRAGLFRKQTQLLYVAALMAADRGHFAIASVLMEHVAAHFGVASDGCSSADDADAGADAADGAAERASRDARNGWLSLSLAVLGDAAAVAQEAQRPQFTAQVLCRLLALQGPKELEHAALRALLSRHSRKSLGLEKFVRRRRAPLGAAAASAAAATDAGGGGGDAAGATGGALQAPVGGLPPRPPGHAPPSLAPPAAAANATLQRGAAGGQSPAPSGASDRRSVSSALTAASFRAQSSARGAAFNPLAAGDAPGDAGGGGGGAAAAGGATDAFLASLRSLTVPKLQLSVAGGGGGGSSDAAGATTPPRAAPQATRSPEFRRLTRATQAQAATGAAGRTFSGAHSNSVSQRLLRSLAGDLLALDAAAASSFNLFDAGFGLTPAALPPAAAAADAAASAAGGSAALSGALATGAAATAIGGSAAPSPASLLPPGAAAAAAASALPEATLFHLVDLSLARDVLRFVTARLAPHGVALEAQEAVASQLLDAAAGLARPARALAAAPLPHAASSALTHGAAPVASALRALLATLQPADDAAAAAAAGGEAPAASAFFYDPFAARRQQQQRAAAQAADAVTWSWAPAADADDDGGHCVVATLANPLAVALPLRVVCELRVASADGAEAALALFPVEVEVPPRALQHELRLPLRLAALRDALPAATPATRLTLRGARLSLGGLSEFVAVDAKGAADLDARCVALQRLVRQQRLQSDASAAAAAADRPTARTNEVALRRAPCVVRVALGDAERPLRAEETVAVELLPGETRALRLLLTVAPPADAAPPPPDAAVDVRVRLLRRGDAARDAAAATLSDFALLVAAPVAAPVAGGGDRRSPQVTATVTAAEARADGSRRFVVELALRETRRGRRDAADAFDVVVDVVPLSAAQATALRMLRGLRPAARDALAAAVAPEEAARWAALPMARRLVRLQTRRLAPPRSLRWWHALPCDAALPDAQRRALCRALRALLAPLRAATAPPLQLQLRLLGDRPGDVAGGEALAAAPPTPPPPSRVWRSTVRNRTAHALALALRPGGDGAAAAAGPSSRTRRASSSSPRPTRRPTRAARAAALVAVGRGRAQPPRRRPRADAAGRRAGRRAEPRAVLVAVGAGARLGGARGVGRRRVGAAPPVRLAFAPAQSLLVPACTALDVRCVLQVAPQLVAAGVAAVEVAVVVDEAFGDLFAAGDAAAEAAPTAPLPGGVMASGKLLSRAAVQPGGLCQHALRLCFTRHGLFALRFVVRAAAPAATGDAAATWWTTRHAATVRVCLDE